MAEIDPDEMIEGKVYYYGHIIIDLDTTIRKYFTTSKERDMFLDSYPDSEFNVNGKPKSKWRVLVGDYNEYI